MFKKNKLSNLLLKSKKKLQRDSNELALSKHLVFQIKENFPSFIKVNHKVCGYSPISMLTNSIYKKEKNPFIKKIHMLSNPQFWYKKFAIMMLIYTSLDFIGRFRHKTIKSIFHILFFENTISLKNLFYFWIKYMPLKSHKKLIITIMSNMIFIQFLAQINLIRFKLLFYIKGKLGSRGDSKKRRSYYAFAPHFKYKIGTGLYYDGIGAASRFGTTFLKINYAQTNFNDLKL